MFFLENKTKGLLAFWIVTFFIIVFFYSSINRAIAHPHVFVDAKLNIILNKNAEITKLEQIWTFDEIFTSGVILDFDSNGDHLLDKTELSNIGKIIKKSMAEYAYFQSILQNGQSIAINPPDVMLAKIENNHFILSFVITPQKTVKLLKNAIYRFSVFDPTFYVAVDFSSQQNFTITPLPKMCKSQFIRPDVDTILAKSAEKLSEEFYADAQLSLDFAMQLATYLEVKCQ